jgi:hypothetical protein
MATDNILRTFGDVSRKEDVVLNMVEILTAEENQVLSSLGKTRAINTIHAYLTDTLATAGSQAVAEGADYSNLVRSTPTRLTNIVEEIAVPFRVSRVQQAVEHYHGKNELERQLSKALMEWGNAAEFDIVRSTLVSGASGTVAKMSGIKEAISKSTNYTAHNSGVAFSASILDGLMKNNWDNSNGDVATDLFVGSVLRKSIDTFTQKTNVVVNSPGISSIVRTISTFETAFGTLTIHKHRYVTVSGDTFNDALAIRKEKLKLAYLDKPTIQTDLAKSGPYDPRAVYGSLTLEVRNQDSNWLATGFITGSQA